MFQKILVALDLTDASQRVFEDALALAQSTGASLMLMHSLSGDRDGGPAMPISGGWDYYAAIGDGAWARYQAEWKAYTQRGMDMLRSRLAQAMAAGVTAEFTQLDRPPERGICELARTWEADVIVVGSHGRTGLSELFLGSVSNYVTHHAPCSVWVVRLNEVAAADSVLPTALASDAVDQPADVEVLVGS